MNSTRIFATTLGLALLLTPAAMAQEPALEELRLQMHRKEVELHGKHRMQEIDMLGRPGPDQVGEELQDIRRDLFELDVEKSRLAARRDAVVKRIEEAEALAKEESDGPARPAQIPERIGEVFDRFIASLGPLEENLEEEHIDGLHGHLEEMRDDIAEHLERAIGALEEHREHAERIEEMRHWLVETEAELAEVAAQRQVLSEREAELTGRMEELRGMLRERAKEEQELDQLRLKIHAREMREAAAEKSKEAGGQTSTEETNTGPAD